MSNYLGMFTRIVTSVTVYSGAVLYVFKNAIPLLVECLNVNGWFRALQTFSAVFSVVWDRPAASGSTGGVAVGSSGKNDNTRG